MSASTYHIPVLPEASLTGLGIGTQQHGVFVDATFGGGGHTQLMLDRLDEGSRIYGFDQDPDALANVPQDTRFELIPENFRFIRNFLRLAGVRTVDGILADLGVSSHQFDQAEIKQNPRMHVLFLTLTVHLLIALLTYKALQTRVLRKLVSRQLR